MKIKVPATQRHHRERVPALAGSLFHKFVFFMDCLTCIDNGDLITLNLNLRRCQFLGVSSSGDFTRSIPFTGHPLTFRL